MNDRFLHRMFFTLAAIIFVAAVAPTWAADFGNLQGGNAPSAGLSGDYKRGSRFTLTEPGILKTLKAQLDGNGGPQTGFQWVTMSIYADANGVPGVKLAESFAQRVNALSAWKEYDFDVAQDAPLPPGDYWLVLHTGGTADGGTPGIIRDLGTTGSNNWYGNADAFADGASSPFGTGGVGTVSLALAATYVPASQAKFAGRATVAATPSGGLTANYKRGSRFTMPENGRIYALTAYLDGLGAASGSQRLRYALYRDAGGVPGALVTESYEVTVRAGQPGRWMTSFTQPTDIAAGDYWVVIHSGDTSGVARDYGDGAANFYANADAYSDDVASTFGSGNAGSVTLSAAAMYVPANTLVTMAFGRNTIAATPSSGLTANYMRGSTFAATAMPWPNRATAIWAYLDGNGGASGSQQVRVGVYLDSGVRNVPFSKMWESEPVTIPAGMSPRWVRFALPAPIVLDQEPGYALMLESGDTGGVVRDYGDGDANWLGLPDTFSDGGIPYFYGSASQGDPSATWGSVTLSMYIEYTAPANPL